MIYYLNTKVGFDNSLLGQVMIKHSLEDCNKMVRSLRVSTASLLVAHRSSTGRVDSWVTIDR